MFGFRWLNRGIADAERRRTATHTSGDRVVWRGLMMEGRVLVYSGTYVADGPGPYVTIRHDGAPSDARVRPERLWRESDYLALVESHRAVRPTRWG
ncbi:hypothetical protein LQ327_30000 [Actinomycetospora endophytica]|uniref:Uncharacterized protein n=1 Tax=Actinomycetospora endophytica TaxID=2291215 RepID=A0ABS8PH59_9PSEU|nr:hypothetical protein [Actinomycetospora endophytica]MCD2197612.1 hypothetical protein [Actinomycetospora endophytica]